ncbi:hypothetical protein NAT51_08285 [Flavobacterium amniphilum]|uniref:DUF6607 family protein n=1 Tax=Flavobacterium amniphilum TaxID=1834035 RepID=UPI00202A36D0|nr:DUF6607 family protein [Flavobacterium amniphilum]MCL9805517.1 hypothetical protein [Flavobacterium amniphilum]
MKTFKSITILALSMASLTISAQDKKKKDTDAIKAMCGCYEVEFNFTETFKVSKDEAYKPSPSKKDFGLEWVELVEDKPNKIVMQHLLIVGDTTIVKHWRQDWEFENTKFYEFYKDKTWKFVTLPSNAVKGQWTQRVYQVDDSPRYEGTASWVHVDGTSTWKNTADAPLPRREHTIRNDYNVLKRRNIHEITKYGWLHEQDNEKIQRDDKGADKTLAFEKGMDYYRKVDNSKCIAAQNYWKKNNVLWKNVRDKWQSVFNLNKDLNLETVVKGQPLFMHLFDLKPTATKAESDKIIDDFVKKS